MGTQVGIVVGGGNFWRGRTSGKMDHTRADHMGMMATVKFGDRNIPILDEGLLQKADHP